VWTCELDSLSSGQDQVREYGNCATVWLQYYDTVQKPYLSQSTWTHPHEVLQELICYQQLQNSSFCVVCYWPNKNI